MKEKKLCEVFIFFFLGITLTALYQVCFIFTPLFFYLKKKKNAREKI